MVVFYRFAMGNRVEYNSDSKKKPPAAGFPPSSPLLIRLWESQMQKKSRLRRASPLAESLVGLTECKIVSPARASPPAWTNRMRIFLACAGHPPLLTLVGLTTKFSCLRRASPLLNRLSNCSLPLEMLIFEGRSVQDTSRMLFFFACGA